MFICARSYTNVYFLALPTERPQKQLHSSDDQTQHADFDY